MPSIKAKKKDRVDESSANQSESITVDNIKTLAVAVKGDKTIISGVQQNGTKIKLEKIYKDRYGPSVSIK